MKLARLGTRVAAIAATAIVAGGISAGPASAHDKPQPLGTKSLATVLTSDKSGFDRNGNDFDVLTAAVQAVLKAKPASAVGVLANGKTAVTAFIPTDHAFEVLVADITGTHRLPTEKQAFTAVAGLGIPTVESILLYHVVPGATVDRAAALRSDGAKLKTANGASITVDVVGRWRHRQVKLIDADKNDCNPRVVAFDVNKGNRQIAHAVNRVLRPVDLP